MDSVKRVPNNATHAYWHPKSRQPRKDGWYAVVLLGGELSARYYEDGTWWYVSKNGLVPNDSFKVWGRVQPPSDAQMKSLQPVA